MQYITHIKYCSKFALRDINIEFLPVAEYKRRRGAEGVVFELNLFSREIIGSNGQLGFTVHYLPCFCENICPHVRITRPSHTADSQLKRKSRVTMVL